MGLKMQKLNNEFGMQDKGVIQVFCIRSRCNHLWRIQGVSARWNVSVGCVSDCYHSTSGAVSWRNVQIGRSRETALIRIALGALADAEGASGASTGRSLSGSGAGSGAPRCAQMVRTVAGSGGAEPCLSAAIRAHKERRSRCFPASIRAGLAADLHHTGYLARDSASKDGERGTFFDAQQDKVDGRSVTREWEEDRHHFRLILSPEKGYEIADMRAYVRDVMQRIERDVGTKLDWIASSTTTPTIRMRTSCSGARTSRVKT